LLKEIANTKKLISKTDKDYDSLIKKREKAKSAYEKAQSQATKLEVDFNMAKTSSDRTLEDLYDYQSGLKKEEKQFNKLKGQADKTLSRIKKNLEKAKKAEKDLGIKIPSLSKYQKSADLLDKLMRNA
jgi:septal ring factor EnvC (AmiA/AmiB activator)